VLTGVIGQLPLEIGNITELTLINMENSDLSEGKVPESIGLCTKLVKVHFWNCKLLGEFPTGLQTLKSLGIIYLMINRVEYLYLDVNYFSGSSIPTWICELVELKELLLQNLKMQGNIPACIGALTKLWYLDLSVNEFSGELPIGICDLFNLEQLLIFDTLVEGKIFFF
jgi:Leucine-rich repeat (LRR) protein